MRNTRRDPKQDIGKKAIHMHLENAGTIIASKPDSDHDYDDTISLDIGFGGHRHYFYIEGDAGLHGELFKKHKHKFF